MANAATKLKEINRKDLARAAKERVKKRRFLKRPKALAFPLNAERQYLRYIMKLDLAMIDLVKKTLLPELSRILAEAEKRRPAFDSISLDEYDYSLEVEKLMDLIKTNYADLYSDAEISAFLLRIARAVADQNGKALGRVFVDVLGVDIFKTEPWLVGEMQSFVTQNVSLIKTLPSKFFPAIEQKVFNAARIGLSYRELLSDLRKEFNTTRFQAERIARDQIGKFNGQLTQLRQRQAGIDKYIWRTMRDERVRSEHKSREGKIFSWNKPPEDGHPQEPIMCRCYAEPVFDDLLNF